MMTHSIAISALPAVFLLLPGIASCQWSLARNPDNCRDDSLPIHYTLLNGWRGEGDVCCQREVDLDRDNGTILNRICCSTTLTQCDKITDPDLSQIACCRGKWKGSGKSRYYDSNHNCNKDRGYVARCRGPDSGKYQLTGNLMPEPEDMFRLGALIEHRCCVYRDKPLLYARYLKNAGPPSPQTISLLSCCSSPIIAYRDRCQIFADCCAVQLFSNNTRSDNSFLCPSDGKRMPCCRSNDASYCSTGSCVHKHGYATGCQNVSSIIRKRAAVGDFVHKFSDL